MFCFFLKWIKYQEGRPLTCNNKYLLCHNSEGPVVSMFPWCALHSWFWAAGAEFVPASIWFKITTSSGGMMSHMVPLIEVYGAHDIPSRSTRQDIKYLINARSHISSISLLIMANDREDGKNRNGCYVMLFNRCITSCGQRPLTLLAQPTNYTRGNWGSDP